MSLPAPLPDKDDAPTIPFSIEAEQQLLGALLTDNGVYDRIQNIVLGDHFYEPVHTRIFDLCAERIKRSALASPVTIKAFMDDDPGLKALGGAPYLARLASAAISSFAAPDYAQMIREFAMRRSLIGLGNDIAARASTVRVDDDATEQIKAAEQVLYTLGEQGVAERGFVSFLAAANEAVDIANAAYRRDGQLSGLSTGLIDLDAKMGGLNPSDLIILAGRPSMGKTSLATNIAFNIARNHKPGQEDDGQVKTGGVVAFFSLEMSASQLATRVLSEAAQVPSEKIRRGDMTEDEFRRFVQTAIDLQNAPLYIDDTPALPINQLAARARKLKRTRGLDVLMVDYLQLLRPASAKDSRVNEVSEITQGLKAIAKELNVPVLALSQLSRQVENREDKRPQLSDLRESGSIEQDADIVMFVFREEYYHERMKPSEDDPKFPDWKTKAEQVFGKAEVIIGKQRHGPIGTVPLSFEGQFTRFGNLETHRDDASWG